MSEAVNECGPRVRASDYESILSHVGGHIDDALTVSQVGKPANH